MEIAARKKRNTVPPRASGRGRRAAQHSPNHIFEQLVSDMDLSTATRYNAKKSLDEGDLIEHPTFGTGLVTAVVDEQKVKVVFRDGERLLICNRGG